MLAGIYAESGTRRYILIFNMITRPKICRIETKLGMVLLTSEHIHVVVTLIVLGCYWFSVFLEMNS